MDDKKIITDLKNDITLLVKEQYGKSSKQIEANIEEFLNETKESLLRWTNLLNEKQITIDEFKLLVAAQKDFFYISQLHQAGISKISLGHFKNKIVNLIINKIFQILL